MPTEWSEGIIISELADEPALSEELSAVLEAVESSATPCHAVLNFSGVGHVNSSNLAQLLRLRKAVMERGRALVLCSLPDDVWSVLLVTGLDKVFRFAEDPLTALAGLQLEDSET